MNRNKLIEMFVSNLSNAIVHEILEKAIDKEDIAEFYKKEIKNSLRIAVIYREKINPVNRILPDRDIEEIKRKVINNVKSELKLRIEKGYKNLDVLGVEQTVEDALKEMNVL